MNERISLCTYKCVFSLMFDMFAILQLSQITIKQYDIHRIAVKHKLKTILKIIQ